MGGLHRFMNWDRPILTDSGGFQVFSLASLRKIKEEGVYFNSHIDGRKIFMGPEESMQIQSNLASTIAMAFDECPPHPATREYMQNSVDRTTRWLHRCKAEMTRLNGLEDTINKHQMLFGINQGGTFEDIRIEHAKAISELELDGYALGGLAVGESHADMYNTIPKTNLSLSARSHLLKVWISTRIMQVPISSSMQGRSGRPLTSCWIYLRYSGDRGLIQIRSGMMPRYITRPTLPL
jgi:queuine tRNA-ribosyltransferase